MDDSPVQTALCVIGHPIAGNPAQFCISRILQSLGMDWQFLSFDVPPESLQVAIAGIDVLHFAGALIASPHQSAVARLVRGQQQKSKAASALPFPPLPSPALSNAAAEPVAHPGPLSENSTSTLPIGRSDISDDNSADESLWCDALARDAEGKWELCNFIGETLLQFIQEHEQRIGTSLVTCVFLGDAASFHSLMRPFQQCLPETTLCLGSTSFERLPGEYPPKDLQSDEAPASLNAATLNDSNHMHGIVDSIPEPADNANTDESSEASPPPDPLHCPLLLIQPMVVATAGKKSGSKVPANQAIVEALLEDLHPQSLVVHLAPTGVPWPVLRGQDDTTTRRINPLDLEVGRIAAAMRRWTGKVVDREALAEAIEEYLEI
jgi:hypothetical protein